MVDTLSSRSIKHDHSASDLLSGDEIVVIVDDSPEIVILLQHYLTREGLNVATAANSQELQQLLHSSQVALVLLDIGLPGKTGTEILAEIAPQYPDLGIIMVTGTIDIDIALSCLRMGADDYLTKPVNPGQFKHTIYQTLKKRKLAIDNRIFQQQLEASNFRMQFLHSLNLKMNSAYLGAMELDSVLHTILAGITSAEGLKFNRAFLALFDEDGKTLRGKLAIGPSSKEDAGRLWHDIKEKQLGLHDIIDTIRKSPQVTDTAVNQIVRALVIPTKQHDHILIYASKNRKSIRVKNGISLNGLAVPEELVTLLGENNFIVVPLYSPSRSLGVIVADNYITGKPISANDVMALEIFAGQASLAIEHSTLFQGMTEKIAELELVTTELEQNKNRLVEAERYATLGYISAQLVHAIRNPITSIGGTARLLEKRDLDPNLRRLFTIIREESSKIETTLNDLFHFVEKDNSLNTAKEDLTEIVKKSLAVFYATFRDLHIDPILDIGEERIEVVIDGEKIRQVLMHLVRHAIESMPNGGKIVVTLASSEKIAYLSIADSGAGIEQSGLNTISSHYYTTKTYGTGLGLTLVEQILNLHDLDFTLRPNHDSGLTATIAFPLND